MYRIKEVGVDEGEVFARVRARYGENISLVTRRATIIKKWGGLLRQKGWEYLFSVNDSTSSLDSTTPLAEEENLSLVIERLTAMEHRLLQRLVNLEKEVDQLQQPTEGPRNDGFRHYLLKVLAHNEFPADFSVKIVDQLMVNLNETTKLAAVQQLGLLCHKALRFTPLSWNKAGSSKGPHVIVCVGPSGVGKTTTIAQLASSFSSVARQRRAKLLLASLDSYRVGAYPQLEAFGCILNLPTQAVKGYSDLLRLVENSGPDDLIFIDTIGRNPRNVLKMKEIKQILSACRQPEVCLLLTATSSYLSCADTLRCYAPLAPVCAILTKLDEAERIGAVVTALIEANMPLSYITHGQAITRDMSLATPTRLLEKFTAPGMQLDWQEVIHKQERAYLYGKKAIG